MATYLELLRDPRWQRRRLEVMSAADFACQRCDAKDKTLNVHHVVYRFGAMPWDYDDSELHCLCEPCHREITDLTKRMDAVILELKKLGGIKDMEFVIGVARTFIEARSGSKTIEAESEIEHDGARITIKYLQELRSKGIKVW